MINVITIVVGVVLMALGPVIAVTRAMVPLGITLGVLGPAMLIGGLLAMSGRR